MVVVTFIFAFALAFAAAFFALQNPALVMGNFFGLAIQASLAVFVLAGLAVGFLIGVLVMLPGRIKSGIANSRHRKKIAELEGKAVPRKAAASE
ncbi:MAG: LapA family protein [Anaerolineales bacterium]|jgi:uncharacterized integral membrane protein|nr:LapA family protein [Chloroflexota bacterium]MBK6644911.1 LapA family protein [Anaerolineales bacterium]